MRKAVVFILYLWQLFNQMSLTVQVKEWNVFWKIWYARHLNARNLLGQVLRKFRRFILGNFRPEYIQKSIEQNRKGECHRCGLCCELIYKCPFLGKDGHGLSYCRIYGDLRPANCRNYPFDSTDSEIDRCGYKFERE